MDQAEQKVQAEGEVDQNDTDAHNGWQLVDDVSLSQCGSSPRSVSQIDYNSELDEFMTAEEAVPGSEAATDSKDTVLEDVAPGGTQLILQAMSAGNIEDHQDSQGVDSPCAKQMIPNLGLPTSTQILSTEAHSSSSVPSLASSSITSDSFTLADQLMGDGSESLGDPLAEQELSESMSSYDSTDSQDIVEAHADEGRPDCNSDEEIGLSSSLARAQSFSLLPSTIGAGKAESSKPFWTAAGLPNRAQWASYNNHKASPLPVSTSSFVRRLLSALKAYIEAAGTVIPAAIRARVSLLRSGHKHRGTTSCTGSLCLAASLVSVSALLMWTVAKNCSLSRQLAQSRLDLEHHVMTILNLNDKMSKGVNIPVLQRCSYVSQTRIYNPLPVKPFALSTSVF